LWSSTRAASSIVRGSSSSWPQKWRTRSRRSRIRIRSGARRRAATTARQAGCVAAIRGRSRVSIGVPCSREIERNDAACFSVVKPRRS
jgi:hypothetical protein